MLNPHVLERLAGIQHMLMGAHAAGKPMSASSKGTEREHFIEAFLSRVFPPPFRFGHGDVTDATGNRSGQVDVVVEYPFLPSLPVIGAASSRLYLAEGVAAVIEVKSDLTSQWPKMLTTAGQLANVQRDFGSTMSYGPAPAKQLPLFAVGYTGWKQTDTALRHLKDGPIAGLLVIERGLFVAPGVTATGPWSLWGLICCLHQACGTLKATSAHPAAYAQPDATADQGQPGAPHPSAPGG